MFSRKANLVVTDGKLDLAAGKTATVRSVKLGDGSFVPAGTYTKGDGYDFLTGEGSLCVRKSSDQPDGMMLIFR